MNLKELLGNNEFTYESDIADIEISSITTSQEKIDSATLFVLLKSIKIDISKIIDYILEKKPRAIICDNDVEINSHTVPVIKTDSTRLVLPYLYSRFYNINFTKMRFAAVTGTNGKTTTATMLAHILKEAGCKVGFIGTGKILINGVSITDTKYSMTTPDPELLYYSIKQMEQAGCDTVVMEVSSHALYFDKVAPIAFDVSIFTNLSPEHLDFHKSIDNYYESKLKLFSKTKVGIFNMDDPYSAKAAESTDCKKFTVGVIRDADATAKDIKLMGLYGSEYIYRERNRLFKVKIKLGGAHNIYNSMMAISAAIVLNAKPCIAKNAISGLKSIDGRLDIIWDNVIVIIDYAHTEEALLNVLKTIASDKKTGQNLITVFGCGGERDRQKRPLMAKVAERFSDYVIVTTDNSRNEPETDIIRDILEGFKDTQKRKVISSRQAAIEYAILSANDGDIIAIIGKGHERYNIDKSGYHDFDERRIICEAIRKRKGNLNISDENTNTPSNNS